MFATNVEACPQSGFGFAGALAEVGLPTAEVPLALFVEFESLLAREPLFAGCSLDARQRDDLFIAFLSVCRWTTIHYGWRPNLRDEADNHLIELAVAGGASVIVTKNVRDFRGADLQFPGLGVLSPEDLLKEI